MGTYMHFTTLLLGGALVILAQWLFNATARDVTKRLVLTAYMIQAGSILAKVLSTIFPFLRHPVWSGDWTVSWEVESQNFDPVNSRGSELFLWLTSVSIEGTGRTSKGECLPYSFVGMLTRDKTIVTGTWTDKVSGPEGYHGVFQIRLNPSKDEASGLWIGFSHSDGTVKSGQLTWTKTVTSTAPSDPLPESATLASEA